MYCGDMYRNKCGDFLTVWLKYGQNEEYLQRKTTVDSQ